MSFLNVNRSDWSKNHALQSLRAWQRVLNLTFPTPYPKGAKLFHQGDRARDVFLLAEGLVLLSCHLPNGDRSILGLRFPGQLLTPYSYAIDAPHPFSAQAIEKCKIYKSGRDDFCARVFHNPEGNALLHEVLQVDLINAAISIIQLKTFSPQERFQGLLHLLAAVRGIVPRRGVLRVPVSLLHEQLAGLLGLSPRQFKRIKRQMRDTGQLTWEHRHFVLRSSTNQAVDPL